tara:strand:+ start:312 stop:1292 length:981 start_codon:yes stop_codon:yes gene_type:complete
MQKKIKDIVVGDFVKSWDFDKEKIVPAKVLKLWKHKNDKQCYKLNNKLTITGSHQVYTKDGYKLTKDIKVGDKLLGSDGKYIKVKSFKLHELDVPYVHNLTVKINNYFADGVLVHNTGAGGTWGKAGTWHGKDAPAQSAIDGLKQAIMGYRETSNLMQESYAEQTGEVGEKLDLQRKELSVQMKASSQAGGQETAALESKLGRSNLATVGGEQRRALELKRESEGESFGVKHEALSMTAEHEKAGLRRNIKKEELSMKQGLRGAITTAKSQTRVLDDEWEKRPAKNVLAGDTDPDSMLDKWDEGHTGFQYFCVVPNTKIEMWDSNG